MKSKHLGRNLLRGLTITLAGLSANVWQPVDTYAAPPAAVQSAAVSRRPNVVFILADDLGWSDTSLYGSKFYETPNLEALAKCGVKFNNAYAANPLCSPTRASILTGQYPARLGITQAQGANEEERFKATLPETAPAQRKVITPTSATRLPLEHVTIAERLKAEGYATGHFGKWHVGREPYDALHQGFDVDVPHYWGPGPAGSYVAPWKFPGEFKGEPGEHIEDRMATEAISFINANKDKPFYLNYWSFSVHGPWGAKQDLINKYKAKADPNNAQHNPVYGAMVETLDTNIGRLVKAIDDAGLTNDTIFVFTSDNGGNSTMVLDDIPVTSNAPLRGGKASIYEGGIREPLVAVWPGKFKPGTTNDGFVSSVDYYPTLLELLQVKPDPDQKFDGISVAAAFTGGVSPRDTVFSFFPHHSRSNEGRAAVAVRKGDWKLLRFFGEGEGNADGYELYNLANDIGELTNLADKEPARVKELDALISQFLTDTNAVIPKPNPDYSPREKKPDKEPKKRKSKNADGDND